MIAQAVARYEKYEGGCPKRSYWAWNGAEVPEEMRTVRFLALVARFFTCVFVSDLKAFCMELDYFTKPAYMTFWASLSLAPRHSGPGGGDDSTD